MIRAPTPSKSVQLSTNASSWTPRMCTCQLVGLQLVFSVVQSYTFLSPRRESWPPEGRHNRIRHIDPPKSSRFQNLKLTQQAPAHDPSPPRRQKMYVWMCARLSAHLFERVCDSSALETPWRELWCPKCRHNRIRHVDPPPYPIFSKN